MYLLLVDVHAFNQRPDNLALLGPIDLVKVGHDRVGEVFHLADNQLHLPLQTRLHFHFLYLGFQRCHPLSQPRDARLEVSPLSMRPSA